VKIMSWLIASVLGGCVATSTLQESDSQRLASHARQLLRILEPIKDQGTLVKELRQTLRAETEATLPKRLHRLLESRCLMRVTINPESRVKAARGPATARLRRDGENVFLIRIQNEAGVTHPLKVSVNDGEGNWLKSKITAVSEKGLSGSPVEYVLLRLTARASGKREATLTFDVGQGTQDLGFRAEVPVLFSIP
jgi:hypothetical protein